MDERPATRRIDAIAVGVRHRRELGDVASLARSIERNGLLHPVVVRPDGRLIAGERRLEAYKLLGRTEVPVTEVDLAEIVRGELAENADRLNFLPSEIEAIRRTLEPIERAAAKERMAEGGKGWKVSTPSEPRKTRDRVGAFAGVSGRTVEKIAAVCEAAEAEPEKFGKLLENMDKTGHVNGNFKRLTVMRQAERLRAEPPPLPNGKWRVVVIDFPWAYDVRQDDPSHRAARPYAEMSIAQICAKAAEFRGLLHDDVIVWVWCTNYHLIRYAAPALDALGVSERSILTWVKNRFGTGDLLRSQTEPCVFAVRGSTTVTLTNEATVLFAPMRGHSEKPPEFYELVERLCPASGYLDLFSRYRHSALWTCWGAEAPALASSGELEEAPS